MKYFLILCSHTATAIKFIHKNVFNSNNSCLHLNAYIEIYSNRVTRDGALELAKVLKENTAIEILDLGYNRLEDDGACHIAEALKTFNTNLQT